MTIKPLFDRVLVKRLEQENKTSGGILLPDSVQQKSTVAEVCEVGSGRELSDGKLVDLKVKKGDKVLLSEVGWRRS